MNMFVTILSGVAIVVGAIWALQGAGLLGGSFMTGQTAWLWIGIATALAGCAVLFWARRQRR